jgi:hypothetical protein
MNHKWLDLKIVDCEHYGGHDSCVMGECWGIQRYSGLYRYGMRGRRTEAFKVFGKKWWIFSRRNCGIFCKIAIKRGNVHSGNSSYSGGSRSWKPVGANSSCDPILKKLIKKKSTTERKRRKPCVCSIGVFSFLSSDSGILWSARVAPLPGGDHSIVSRSWKRTFVLASTPYADNILLCVCFSVVLGIEPRASCM